LELRDRGEDAAARYLAGQRVRILHRNWRIKAGEIDLVAKDGRTLVFVEVKARNSREVAEPFEAVNYWKQVRLRRLAEAYIAFEKPDFDSCRFDVVSVFAGNPPSLLHISDAF
jgi:putative endonuclease